MTRRLRALGATLALLSVAAAGCGGTESANGAAVGPGGSPDQTKVTLRVGDQKGSSVKSLLAAAGLLKGIKYKISWSLFPSGPPILEGINAGAVDFGSVGNTPPVFAAAARSNIAIVAATEVRLDGQAIVVPNNSPLRTPAELRGKKIAVARGSSGNAQLLGVLKKNGLGLTDVQPQYLQPADALTALASGKVDAWATWEPYTAQAEAEANARILADGNGYVNGYGFQVTSRKTLGDKGRVAALKDFLSRYRRAVLWTNGHQKQWAAVWAKDTGMPLPVAETAVRRRLTKIVKIDDTVITSEQQLADAFTGARLLPGKVEIAGYFDRRFNDLAATS
ncbi:MAG: aliphatic sulfonates family transporter, periplasmic ligand-binding protein [Streptosporangiaceae bacterium]|jgi:sulfonate transport system substrate-binding protein|nr:aliphatic sulfonates family transporter, periplasmic ligand-binding protein [Streptosporangiaceae bacterium]